MARLPKPKRIAHDDTPQERKEELEFTLFGIPILSAVGMGLVAIVSGLAEMVFSADWSTLGVGLVGGLLTGLLLVTSTVSDARKRTWVTEGSLEGLRKTMAEGECLARDPLLRDNEEVRALYAQFVVQHDLLVAAAGKIHADSIESGGTEGISRRVRALHDAVEDLGSVVRALETIKQNAVEILALSQAGTTAEEEEAVAGARRLREHATEISSESTTQRSLHEEAHKSL